MGMIYAEVTLSNPPHRNDALAPMVVRALVDTGAVNLCMPAHIALQLELEKLALDRGSTDQYRVPGMCWQRALPIRT